VTVKVRPPLVTPPEEAEIVVKPGATGTIVEVLASTVATLGLLLVQVKVSPGTATPLLSVPLAVTVSEVLVTGSVVDDAVTLMLARAPGVGAGGVGVLELELLEQLQRKTQEAARKRSVRGMPGKRGRRDELKAFSVMRRPNFLRQRFHAALLPIAKSAEADREMHRGL
jgi:hypothetical protein